MRYHYFAAQCGPQFSDVTYYSRNRYYITLHYKTIYSGQGKKNCKVHYGASHTTMLLI